MRRTDIRFCHLLSLPFKSTHQERKHTCKLNVTLTVHIKMRALQNSMYSEKLQGNLNVTQLITGTSNN